MFICMCKYIYILDKCTYMYILIFVFSIYIKICIYEDERDYQPCTVKTHFANRKSPKITLLPLYVVPQ